MSSYCCRYCIDVLEFPLQIVLHCAGFGLIIDLSQSCSNSIRTAVSAL